MSTATLSDSGVPEAAAFDAYAAQYEQALHAGLSVSGESPLYFAERRIAWVAQLLNNEMPVDKVLDYGCGVGLAVSLLEESLQPQEIWGFDPASAAIERAIRDTSSSNTHFVDIAEKIPDGEFDLAYCNGVFHHIDLSQRGLALAHVYRALRPGGWFAFWENNPWNPGTRYVMSRIPFDQDAIVIAPPEARRLLAEAGFTVLRTDAWFVFPKALSWLRPLETLVHRLPLGAQYLVLAQKPRKNSAKCKTTG